jgi:alpha-beta hydrolase superfamily lysophospholipase
MKNGFHTSFGDPAMAQVALADPLVFGGRTPAVTTVQILDAAARLCAAAATVFPPSTALLVAHGSADLRTSCAATEAFVEATNLGDKTFLRLPGARHMLLYDTPDVTGRVYADLRAWLAARL